MREDYSFYEFSHILFFCRGLEFFYSYMAFGHSFSLFLFVAGLSVDALAKRTGLFVSLLTSPGIPLWWICESNSLRTWFALTIEFLLAFLVIASAFRMLVITWKLTLSALTTSSGARKGN
jgi:hypothetical protein